MRKESICQIELSFLLCSNIEMKVKDFQISMIASLHFLLSFLKNLSLNFNPKPHSFFAITDLSVLVELIQVEYPSVSVISSKTNFHK